MAAKWIETITGPLEQKKQYREAKRRLERLPEPYLSSGTAFNRYLMTCGGVTDGDTVVQMFVDSVDLWERAAIDGTPVDEIVGEDPVDFAETFARAYSGKHWMDKERARLTETIDRARAAQRANGGEAS